MGWPREGIYSKEKVQVVDPLPVQTKVIDGRLSEDVLFHSWNGPQPLACRTILLVEPRRDVLVHLAAALTEAGFRVERSACAADAPKRCRRRPADLLIVGVDRPDDRGWLLTARLRLTSFCARFGLYCAWPSDYQMEFAEFVGADGLIGYQGDLCSVRRVA